MPGPYFDGQLFFSSQDNEGWSEHYIIAQTDYTLAENVLEDLVPLRAALMTPWFKVIGGRLSDRDVQGDSYPVDSSAFHYPGTYAPTIENPLEANEALKCRLYGAPPMRGLIYMRGMDASVISGRHFTSPTTWVSAFNDYADYLIDPVQGFQLYVKDPTTHAPIYTAVRVVEITGVTARKPGRPFGLPVGRHVEGAVVLTSAGGELTGSAPATPSSAGSPRERPPSSSTGSGAPRERRPLPTIPRSAPSTGAGKGGRQTRGSSARSRARRVPGVMALCLALTMVTSLQAQFQGQLPAVTEYSQFYGSPTGQCLGNAQFSLAYGASPLSFLPTTQYGYGWDQQALGTQGFGYPGTIGFGQPGPSLVIPYQPNAAFFDQGVKISLLCRPEVDQAGRLLRFRCHLRR